jgi:hypothetical protein
MTSDDQREALTDLMGSIAGVLADIPCPECRRSAEQYVKTETPRFVREGMLLAATKDLREVCHKHQTQP